MTPGQDCVTNASMRRDAVLNLRVPRELKAILERAAEADLRTVSGMAVVLLAEGLQRRGLMKEQKAPKGRR